MKKNQQKSKKKQPKLHEMARDKQSKQNNVAQWLDFGTDGKPQPSRRGHGYYAAIFIKPRSIRDADSVYRKILSVMSKERPQTSNKILSLYCDRYEWRSLGTITQYLSRFETWGYTVILGSGSDVTWLLMPDIDVNDGDALYRRALENQAEFQMRFDRAKNTKNDTLA